MLDLHMHTIYSDGTCTPEELVDATIAQGVKAIAITDHDNVESLPVARKAAEGKDLEIIPGIEINTRWEGNDIHVLGYFIDPDDELLQEVITKHRDSRVVQMQEMSTKMRKAGIKISYEDIVAKASHIGVLGRPHVAQALLENGQVQTISEAFSTYLKPNCETYVKRDTVPPHEAVEAIYESGGVPVIAHPGDMEIIESLSKELMHYGLRGLEAYHRSHSPGIIQYHCMLAERLDLVVTGGTDFHGPPESYEKAYSRLTMPSYILERLRKDAESRKLSQFKIS